jgi:hypothetical protein
LDALLQVFGIVQVMIAGADEIDPLVTMDFPLYNVYW